MLRLTRCSVTALVLLFLASTSPVSAQDAGRSSEDTSTRRTSNPEPSDLLEYTQPRPPKLSPDGRFVLLETRRGNVDRNRYKRSRRILPTDPSESSPNFDLPRRSRSVRWGPETQQIAYLARGDSAMQVWAKPLDGDTPRQLTEAETGVRSFKFSPDGERIAYTVQKSFSSPESSTDSTRGKDINLGSFSMWDLDELTSSSGLSQTELWIKDLEAESKKKISADLDIDDYSWSPSGNRVAITGVPADRHLQQVSGMSLSRKDLYLYHRIEDRLRMIHRGRQDTTRVMGGTVYYSQPIWSPTGKRVGFRRWKRNPRFAYSPEFGIYNLETKATRYVTADASQDLHSPEFHWVSPNTIFVEYTDHAERGLYRLSLENGTTRPVWTPKGEAKGFSFSDDGSRAAWIQGSFSQPPELYTARRPFDSFRKLTSLNEDMQDLWLPDAESITWTSTDGAEVQGWLLRPAQREASDPPPLLVHVHGGPSSVVRNRFYEYPPWPYPFQVFAARGYAVFIPNYRGSDSFGKDFLETDGLHKEPVSDILTGIDYLADQGLADTTRMGIMGHSHGAWLGPLVVAERPAFDAAAFDGGVRANFFSTYGRVSGWLTRDVNLNIFKGTPYENVQHYADLSPALLNRFTKTTPTLLEYGQDDQTVNGGIELGRAFWHHDTPHEFIIYPGVGHTIRAPALAVETMHRTLDWFERWIPTDEPVPSKSGDS